MTIIKMQNPPQKKFKKQEFKMSLIRKIFLITSLVFLLIVTDTQHSWAVSLSVQQPVIMNLLGNPKATMRDIEAKTQKATDVSIDNPNYQPGGKTKQVEKQEYEASKDIKAEASEALNKDNSKR